MRRIISAAFLAISFAAPVVGQTSDVIPDKRLVYSKDIDFFGADLTNLFDTTLEACERACLSNAQCTAFTFNQRSSSCFPKSGVSEKQTYEGALSAEVYRTSMRALTSGIVLGANLTFLREGDRVAMRAQADGLGKLHPGGQWTVQVLLDAVRDRRADKNLNSAMHWMGAATAQSDASDHWAEYARLALEVEGKNRSERRKLHQRALNAAGNAYLRAPSAAAQVSALQIMADAMEKLGRGRDMIPTLRLAETIQPRDDITAALDKAIGKYGFRITEHRADKDAAAPRICAEFSEPLVKVGVDYTPFVKLPDQSLVVQADGKQICIDGVEHGARYQVTFRTGLPALSGEKLVKDVPLTLYVGDRTASARFPGRAYVLPKAADAAIPLETVNLDEVDLLLRRVSDRNVLRTMQEDMFGRPLSQYEDELFKRNIGEEIWTGKGQVENTLNQDMTTRLPMGDLIKELPAGLYALTARVPGVDLYDDAGATQWFILSDLGLSTMKGADGVHAFVRGLSDADAKKGVEVTLLSRSNRVLGAAVTDAEGYVHFPAGLARGTGGAAPALVLAKQGADDLAFMSLTEPAFDLSDRGVEGREPSGPIDLFLTTDRGAYRAGETIYATALARDGTASALTDLPITAILTRPDGVEYARKLSSEDSAGGHVFAMALGNTVPRGTWTLDMKADPDAPALASQKLLVEDFLPERIDFDLTLPNTPIRLGDTPPLTISTRYLFGAPGADLPIEGTVRLSAIRELDGFKGYSFGRYDDPVRPRTKFLSGAGRTDATGSATVALEMPEMDGVAVPMEMRATIRVSEGSGRPVERRITHALAPNGPMIGIKSLFEDVVAEGTEAQMQIIAINAELRPEPMQVRWTVNRVETRYQWYQLYGNWDWEPVTTRKRVASEVITLGTEPATISAPVEWGRYEVIVERVGGEYLAASSDFYAGWYAPADASSTPDTLELSLDKPRYKSGDTAKLRLVPRFAGTALVTVVSNRVIHMATVEITKGENLIPLTVTDEWGAGAYVTANVIRPMDVASGQNPARALGLSYATIEPGAKQLAVSIKAPDTSPPRARMDVEVQVDGVSEGETAYVTLAAVDLGILNLTGFDSPDPSSHYFGQRRLGMEMRDVYGRLIDGMNGAMGQVRSGGDAASRLRLQSPPPTQELVAYFSGPVDLGADGTAKVTFDMPAFNGTVRLMAVAWSPTGVGQSEADVLVRDPVVVTASLPRFLAPGDQSTALLEIVHATGPSGRMGLDISASGIALDAAAIPSGLTLENLQKQTLRVPIRASGVGDHTMRIALTTPDGKQLIQTLTLPVRANDPEVSEVRRVSLAAGETFSLNDAVFADFKGGTGVAMVSAGPLAKLNAPGLLQALDRYPYGCTEQITSRALPLLYFDEVARAMGLDERATVQKRVDQAIAQVLTRQSSNGAFGLWRPASGEFWLDAYVSDFLSRAKAQGYEVPRLAFRIAMDNLRNRINYAADFDEGGEDIAYALMVLAREGAASMGDLRYYVDVKSEAFTTPLGAAQLGAALASYGDQTRADTMFARAARLMVPRMGDEARVWRSDFGTNLRDAAGVLTLAVEAGSQTVNTAALSDRLASAGRSLSTQEASWTLLAAHALVQNPASAGLTVNGEVHAGPLIRRFESGAEPLLIANTADRAQDITLSTFGVPEIAPDAGGYGYKITRDYYTMDGDLVIEPTLQTGDRMVAVLTITPFEDGASRLMISDPLPAGLEIDNPNLIRGGDIRALEWLKPVNATHSEFRSDRFLAAVDWRKSDAFQLAYIVRAVSAGTYHHPAASVEDMYRPQYRARTQTGQLNVAE
ncbi:alpha-2-macroglobulin family protein [Planktotalea sp.]|uniref:alpha-2-macroglobulin family protein n=1 Tax=Planktotalea sp. TaxID=2029877 RepID=UPI003D6B9DAD